MLGKTLSHNASLLHPGLHGQLIRTKGLVVTPNSYVGPSPKLGRASGPVAMHLPTHGVAAITYRGVFGVSGRILCAIMCRYKRAFVNQLDFCTFTNVDSVTLKINI